MDRTQIEAMLDELQKIAIRLPGIHGTSGEWKTLFPAFGGKLRADIDPNPAGVYAATRKRSALGPVSDLAHGAVRRRGGSPTMANLTIDTKKGWQPMGLTRWAKEHGLEDIEDINFNIRKLDNPLTPKEERGQLWEEIQRGVGEWYNPKEVTPKYYSGVRRAKVVG